MMLTFHFLLLPCNKQGNPIRRTVSVTKTQPILIKKSINVINRHLNTHYSLSRLCRCTTKNYLNQPEPSFPGRTFKLSSDLNYPRPPLTGREKTFTAKGTGGGGGAGGVRGAVYSSHALPKPCTRASASWGKNEERKIDTKGSLPQKGTISSTDGE